jgi:hypothetical protein
VVCRGFIDGVKVSVLALNVVDRGFKLRSRQFKDYIIGICCLARLEASTLTITPPMNPRSTVLEATTLTITPPMR